GGGGRPRPRAPPGRWGEPMGLPSRFTPLVPTYNRPGELARLLRYLSRQPVRFPVLVLDSSDEPAAMRNAGAMRGLDLDARRIAFEPAISPWEKFSRGSEAVTTECCALCADDDLVLTDALPALVNFLTEHAEASAAHGWYFNFEDRGRIEITDVVYSGDSVDRPDALERVLDFVKRYEAVTYAVYRARVLRSVLEKTLG